MKKELSAGVLLFNSDHQILLGKVTEQFNWDIPKGRVEPGEEPRAAALRELAEETSIVLEGSVLEEIGRVLYTRKKDLHLYVYQLPDQGPKPESLSCKSYFQSLFTGELVPEFDGFGWFCTEHALTLVAPSLANTLRKLFEALGVPPSLSGSVYAQ